MSKYLVVFRGMSKNEPLRTNNIWVTNDFQHARFFANLEYNSNNGVIKEYLLPYSTINNLCNKDTFEEIMNDYDCWQEIDEDSTIFDDGEEHEYDIYHDLCFPTEAQLKLLKEEGFNGYFFEYETNVFYIFLFDGSSLKPKKSESQ